MQKTSIARTLVHDPPVMIFDEPTNGLDVMTARTITCFIRECRDNGKTVIFSTHIMSEVERLCDTIGIIQSGKLLVEGTLQELRDKYTEHDLEEIFVKVVCPTTSPRRKIDMYLHNVGIVYRKELTEAIRDRRTVISTVLVPSFAFPVLSVGFVSLARHVGWQSKGRNSQSHASRRRGFSRRCRCVKVKLEKIEIVPRRLRLERPDLEQANSRRR